MLTFKVVENTSWVSSANEMLLPGPNNAQCISTVYCECFIIDHTCHESCDLISHC